MLPRWVEQGEKFSPLPNAVHLTLLGQWTSLSTVFDPTFLTLCELDMNEYLFTRDIDPPSPFVWVKENTWTFVWMCIPDSSPLPPEHIHRRIWSILQYEISTVEWVERTGSQSGQEWVVWLPEKAKREQLRT
eukprot:comp23937_c2_seq1/m.42291 comp23937_c2_seq1/g.42291  ORF comp23937_c2_seq1/g.42291 comp23937_c2_seq1/m.42291 type:complete len:132 (-) comp23937_c2_seq1:68-463(-)